MRTKEQRNLFDKFEQKRKMNELNIRFTKKGFEDFCTALNHRMSKIENDVKWMRRIGYYLSGALTAIGVKLIFGN